MTVIRRAGLDPDAAFLPNAIALVRAHLERETNMAARLVPNRLTCMAPHRDDEQTPEEIWSIAERFVEQQTWSNKSDVLAVLREHLKVRIGREMVTLDVAQQMLSAESLYAGGE